MIHKYILYVIMFVTISCAPSIPFPPKSDDLRNREEFLLTDTDTACTRFILQNTGSWTQILFFSPIWQELAKRADNVENLEDNIEARRVMVRFMEHYQAPLTSCTPEIIWRMKEGIKQADSLLGRI